MNWLVVTTIASLLASAVKLRDSVNADKCEAAFDPMEPVLGKIQSYLPPLDAKAKSMILHAFANGPPLREDLLTR